jgi:hypothetical protein
MRLGLQSMQPNTAKSAVHTKSNLVAEEAVKREGSGPPLARRLLRKCATSFGQRGLHAAT